MTMQQLIAQRQRAFPALQEQFRTTFKGASLKNFYHPIFGFDVIKFDETFIRPRGDQSTFEAVEEQYGVAAVDLVERILDVIG